MKPWTGSAPRLISTSTRSPNNVRTCCFVAPQRRRLNAGRRPATYGRMVANIRPMKPPVSNSIPRRRPAGRPGQLVGGLLVVRGEHDPDTRDHGVELRRRRTEAPRRWPPGTPRRPRGRRPPHARAPIAPGTGRWRPPGPQAGPRRRQRCRCRRRRRALAARAEMPAAAASSGSSGATQVIGDGAVVAQCPSARWFASSSRSIVVVLMSLLLPGVLISACAPGRAESSAGSEAGPVQHLY